MRVLLVTTWDTACGIAEHSAMLKEAVEKADPEIEIVPYTHLDPTTFWGDWSAARFPKPDIVHLNYQAALHSRWTAEQIQRLQKHELKVIVTYHDTGVPNSEQCKSVIDAADWAVVHEPYDDLPRGKTRYWRMGVPGWQLDLQYDTHPRSWCGPRPILGSVGFPFPWKCYDQLAAVTAKAGWALLLIAPNATKEQMHNWQAINPHVYIDNRFLDRGQVVSHLAGCDATAFTYVTHNTGQSGAILQGIAARKPVIALSTCRQFRALMNDDVAHRAIRWATTFEEVYDELIRMPIQRVDPRVVALAEQDSWERLGKKYAELYRSAL